MTGEATEMGEGEGDDPVYSYRPSLLGAPWEFYLRPDALEWRAGRHQGLTRYERISRVRLSYRPVTMQSRRFLTEIWVPDRPRLSIGSSTWRSMVEQGSQVEAYGAFIRELHRRMLAAGTTARFETGSPPVLYWPGLAALGAAAVAIVVVTVGALRMHEWSAAALVGFFLALFAWQGGSFFYRNWPGHYRPEAVPERLVPLR
jgi:hypothetical protein